MILGLIPARGGSKRIPRKNLAMLAGKPLLQWTLEAALESKRLDVVMVSTEDAEIANFTGEWGTTHADLVEINEMGTSGGIIRRGFGVIHRPAELASDGATSAAVMQHAVQVLDPDVLVLLQPTSPIRFRGLIDRCIAAFFAADCDTLATGFISYQFPYGSIGNVPQQEMHGFFYDDGNVYVHKAAHLREGKWFGAKRHELVIEPWYNLELDNVSQFWAAEGIIHRMHQ